MYEPNCPALQFRMCGANAMQTNESEARSRLQAVKQKHDADPSDGRNRFLLAAA
jgi:hypothetical protein